MPANVDFDHSNSGRMLLRKKAIWMKNLHPFNAVNRERFI